MMAYESIGSCSMSLRFELDLIESTRMMAIGL